MSEAAQERTDYDLIIIGSGLGALSTASIMAQLYGSRVLVLERHYVVGGFTHAFKRPDKSPGVGNKSKHEWDVGVHYVGGMGGPTMERSVFDFITGGRLKWNRMPDPFEKFHYPDFTFELHGLPGRFEADLIAQFPDEKAAIERFFKDIKKVGNWSQRKFMSAGLPQPLRFLADLAIAPLARMALGTTKSYLDGHFKSPELKALLASQWGTYGLPPSQSPFMIHAGIINHYMRGGYYPEGGASEMANTVMPIVEAQGGKFLINHHVRKIVLEGGRALGVEAVTHERGKDVVKRFTAPLIVSDAGAYNTYAKLLPQGVAEAETKEVEKFLAPGSAVTVYLGLKESARTLGIEGENHWIYESYNHEANAEGKGVIEGRPRFGYLSFPSLKNNEASTHTAEILGFAEYADFEAWADDRWKKRGEDYDALKDKIADGLIDLVDRHIPGFADLVDYVEVSTPLTVEHFTDHAKGAIYGLLSTPERFKQLKYGAKTPVPGLYLTGADSFMIGVVPALLSGMMTAGALKGPFGFFKVVKAMRALGASKAASV